MIVDRNFDQEEIVIFYRNSQQTVDHNSEQVESDHDDISYHTSDNSDANSECDDDVNVETIDENINTDNVEIDNTTQTFDAYTSESDVLEDDIPPQPQYDPSCAAT